MMEIELIHTNSHTAYDDEVIPHGADDDEIAIQIGKEWAEKVAYFHNSWHVYEYGCWIERDTGEVRRAIRLFLRPHRKKLRGGVSQARSSALANMLEDDLAISDRRMIELENESLPYVNLRNGLFNLETLKLEPHRPEMYLTTQLDFEYDPEAECPVFKRFLRTSLASEDGVPDTSMILLAQEALAYSMSARVDLKASFWLIGKPDTGKSTLVNFIKSLMGRLHATIDLNQLSANRFLLSGIVGKRVVTFTEAEANTFLPDALYKAMVGGRDEIYVDVKNKPAIAFVPTAKFWWGMNNPPRVNDRSGATLNRLLPILFEHAIPPNQRIANLDALLKNERAGVFNYLLTGWRRLMKNGQFTLPERSLRWRENYSKVNDTERLYSESRLLFSDNGVIRGQTLYDDYRDWCARNGFKPKNLGQIGIEWKRLGLAYSQSDGRGYWKGATLRDVEV